MFRAKLLNLVPFRSIFCRAICSCDANFFGQDCSVNGTESLAVVRDLRDSVCNNLAAAAEIQEVTADVLYARVLSISNVLSDVQQVSLDGVATCLRLLVDSLEEYASLAGSETSSALVVKAISNIFALRTDIVNIGGGVDDLQASLITLFGGIQSDLAVGEEPREFIFDNIRVTTWVDGQDEFAGENIRTTHVI